MELNDFLISKGISMAAFADTVGTTTATISRVSDSIVIPRRDLMRRIHEASGGLVTPNDLVGLYCVKPCRLALQGSELVNDGEMKHDG